MKPDFVKKAQGSLRPARQKLPVRVEKSLGYEAPKEFDRGQKKIWKTINQFLAINGVLSPEIIGFIFDYCVLAKQRELCRLKFAKEGTVVEYTNKASKTNPIQSPWLKSYLDIGKEMGNIEKQLGIGILNRDRIN